MLYISFKYLIPTFLGGRVGGGREDFCSYITTDIADARLNRPRSDSVKKRFLSFAVLSIHSLTISLQSTQFWVLANMAHTSPHLHRWTLQLIDCTGQGANLVNRTGVKGTTAFSHNPFQWCKREFC